MRLTPYMYTLVREAEQSGAPLVRGLMWDYPQDPAVPSLWGCLFFAWRVLCAALSLLKSYVVFFATKSCQYSATNGYFWKGVRFFSQCQSP